MNECPKCQEPYSDGEVDCKKCGIVFAKYEKVQAELAQKRAALLTSCKACGKEISKNATSCPHCGEPAQAKVAEQPKPKSKNELTKSQQRYLLLGTVIFLSIFFYVAINGSSSSTKPKDLSRVAFVQCQGFVSKQLKSPSTADFPSLEYSSTPLQDNGYVIISYVDAQNSFGATLRQNWRCKARYKGGEEADPRSWELIEEVKMW